MREFTRRHIHRPVCTGRHFLITGAAGFLFYNRTGLG